MRRQPVFRFRRVRCLLACGFLWVCGAIAVVAAPNSTTATLGSSGYLQILPWAPSGSPYQVETLVGVPFAPIPEGPAQRNLAPSTMDVGTTCATLYFLGMTTVVPDGSDRWGMNEPNHAYQSRLFVGDRFGRIIVRYADDTQDQVPLLFGVNIWAYELATPMQADEAHLKTNDALRAAPFAEPFASDPSAARLLRESLRMTDTGRGKGRKYVFALDLARKPLRSVVLVTAVTARLSGEDAATTSPPVAVSAVSPDFFVRRGHLKAMERLAHRLYQYRADIPASVPAFAPPGYAGPRLAFDGNGFANILGSVYAHNLDDVARNKIDASGMPHSSTPGAPNFGRYIGMGTYKLGDGPYSTMAWSRDAGASLRELVAAGGGGRSALAGAKVLHYLHDPDPRHARPNWKRVINGWEIGRRRPDRAENDGHGSIMLAMAALVRSGQVDAAWVASHWADFRAAAEWIVWQMENPAESAFDGLLYAQSECSGGGGRDIFSNAMACCGLRAFSRIAEDRGAGEDARRWASHADRLWRAISERLTADIPGSGRCFVDVDILFDGWAYGTKRFAPLFLLADYETLDPARDTPEIHAMASRTWAAHKREYHNPASGRVMGYGQGYLTQAALLLDETADMTACIENAAAFCYHPTDVPWIVPEGIILHPSGECWYRNGDLGNAVQQAEILKCARLLAGADDLQPARGLALVPRLPDGWTGLRAQSLPVTVVADGATTQVNARLEFRRTAKGGFQMKAEFERPVGVRSARFGPFAAAQTAFEVKGDGRFEKAMEVNGRSYAYITFGARSLREISVEVRPR